MTDRIAIHFTPDGHAQAVDAGLLRAIAAAEMHTVGCFAAAQAQAAEGERLLRAAGHRGQVERIAPGHPRGLERFGTLVHPAPGIERLAWRRLGIGERRYSLCGIAHASARHAAMTSLAGLLVAPVRSWDAVICTSRVVRDSVRRVLERQAAYLGARLGAQRFELPQLPLIPPGVHSRDFAFDPARRAAARQRCGIGAGDVAFLCSGRLSFRTVAHPQQMFGALERACQRRHEGQHEGPQDAAGRMVHLVLCGRFPDAAMAQAFHEAAAALCPSVRLVVLDGEDGADRADAWAAADVFLALADNVQASADTAPLEALAAGLPCIVSDWDGQRDMVRDGVDGYRIPTVMPDAGAGLDLAQRYDDGVDSYEVYCGHTSQAVALDGAALAQACARLIGDAGLRRQLGEQGRQRARTVFDWAVVFARYRALWDELDERRRADAALAPALPPAVPDRLDPFDVFAAHASARITPASLVELTADASLALLREYRELAINRAGHAVLPTLEAFGQIFGSIESRPMQVDELLDTLGPCDQPTLLRGLAWLCKMDLLRITPPEAPGNDF